MSVAVQSPSVRDNFLQHPPAVCQAAGSSVAELTPIDAFHALVKDLSDILGPSAGIDSSDVDPQDLVNLMQAYTSVPAEWAKYAYSDASRGYTRNLVDKGNGKSNLLVLVWSPGKGSPIHDHANAHCVMKVLKGSLKETRFAWPKDGCAPQVIKETIYPENGTTYMSDELGLHRVSNPDPYEFAVSLHLYTPPNAEHFGCQIFDAKTGKASHIKQCEFFSVTGQLEESKPCETARLRRTAS